MSMAHCGIALQPVSESVCRPAAQGCQDAGCVLLCREGAHREALHRA